MMRKPAGYSNYDSNEVKGVTILEYLLNADKVKSDIKSRDKFPNVDGYLELVDENRKPYGKLEVQVKSVTKNIGEAIIYSCPLSLFSYSEVTINPILLICVNLHNDTAYWIHITNDLIEGLKECQTTINLNLSDNVIDESESYLEPWKDIVKKYQDKMRSFDELYESYTRLAEYTNPAMGMNNVNIGEIHNFLDIMNYYYDNEFQIVKHIYYPNSWKIGIAYHDYADNRIVYNLYPIDKNHNDVQIKIFSDIEKYRKKYRVTAHTKENPIKNRPHEYALDIIESKLSNIFEYRMLNHFVSDYLSIEYVYYVLDRHYTDEFKAGTEQSLNEIHDYLKSHLNDVYKRDVSQKEYLQLNYILGSEPNAFRFLIHALNNLDRNGYELIKRPLLPREYRESRSGFIWNWYSPETLKTNLKTFYDRYLEVYRCVLSANFPTIVDKVTNYKHGSKMIVGYTCKEKYESSKDRPLLYKSYLINNDGEFSIELHNMDEFENKEVFDFNNYKNEIMYDGKKYNIDSVSHGILDFIYRDTPMLNVVYEDIEKDIKNYTMTLRTHLT